MPVMVAFLRAINVGGTTPIKMAVLKALFDDLGYKGVQTLLQSGNVVFHGSGSTNAAAKKIAAGIRKTFGSDVDVMVRTADELRKVASANPFSAAARDVPGFLIVAFLSGEPSAAAIKALKESKHAVEKFVVRGAHIYTHYAGGMGKSKFTPTLIERMLGVRATGRNWNTVTKLIAIADQLKSQ